MSVIILGGGPAASAAALILREADVPVTILEREPFPRFRPGETLHPGIEPLLETLGVADQLRNANYLRHEGVWSGWGEAPRFVPYGEDSRGRWRGFQAVREDFDQRLMKRACERGASVLIGEATAVLRKSSGEVAGVITSIGPLRAEYIFDCTGSAHFLVRQLNLAMVRHSPRLIARYGYVNGEFSGPTPTIFLDARGWTWIAQVAAARFQWTHVTECIDRPTREWLPYQLRDLVSDFSRGADVTWQIADRLAGPGWFVAGDAAAILDPSSSHGVLRAIMSGMMAAHLAVRRIYDALPERVCINVYESWLRSWFDHDASEMSETYRAARLFGFAVDK